MSFRQARRNEMRYKIDAMDLEKKDIPILKEWIKELKSGAICVPIRARKQKLDNGGFYYDEWEPSNSWKPNQKE
jgi:hypothetical protein